jgi:hypothetical protein
MDETVEQNQKPNEADNPKPLEESTDKPKDSVAIEAQMEFDPLVQEESKSKAESVTSKDENSTAQDAINDINDGHQLEESEEHKEEEQRIQIGGLSLDKTKFSDLPPLDFDLFIQRLRHPSSYILVRFFKSFLKEFEKKPWNAEQQVKIVTDFLVFINAQLRKTGQWKTEPEEVFEMAEEGWEKLVTRKVYPALFGHMDDLKQDALIREKIYFHDWVEEKHLDIPSLGDEHRDTFIDLVSQEFIKMDHDFRSPRDKLVCVLNACKIIMSYIEQEHIHASADDFLPVLIFVIMRSAPIKIKSNALFISRFRSPAKLNSEAGYYLTNIMGALSFIEQLSSKSLTIPEEEYEERIKAKQESWQADKDEILKNILPKPPARPALPPKDTNIKRGDSSVSEILSEATQNAKNLLASRMSYFNKFFNDQILDGGSSSSRQRSSSQPHASPQPSTMSSRASSASATSPRKESNKVKSPQSQTQNPVLTNDHSEFLSDLTNQDRELLGDYEMQLALALSMSEEEHRKELDKDIE